MAGKPGLSGRKSKAEEMGLKALLDDCISAKDRRDLFVALKGMARGRGKQKLEAMKLLLAYLYGTPRQSVEVSGKDGGPLEVKAFDYATAVTPIATRPISHSDAPGEDQGGGDGPALGQDADGG